MKYMQLWVGGKAASNKWVIHSAVTSHFYVLLHKFWSSIDTTSKSSHTGLETIKNLPRSTHSH